MIELAFTYDEYGNIHIERDLTEDEEYRLIIQEFGESTVKYYFRQD